MMSAHIELVAWIIHGGDIAYFDYNKWKWIDTRDRR